MKEYSFFKALFTILGSAVILASVLITFSPGEQYIDQYESVSQTEATPETGPKKIVGIVAGHYGFDTGYQCGSDLNFVRETDVDLRLAVMVRDYLENMGYSVDLLQEFDPALSNYTGSRWSQSTRTAATPPTRASPASMSRAAVRTLIRAKPNV